MEALKKQVGNEEGMGEIGSRAGTLPGEGCRERAASLPGWRLTEAFCWQWGHVHLPVHSAAAEAPLSASEFLRVNNFLSCYPSLLFHA